MARPNSRDDQLRLQHLLLPPSLPAIGCTEAAAAYRAQNSDLRLGGDWFDLIDRQDSQSVVAIVGDVVGHGVEQISVMGQLRAASNALAQSIDDPQDILDGLDRFASTVPGARLATLAVVVMDGSQIARVCCAGHPPPILIAPDGSVELINSGRRPPLTIAGEPGESSFRLAIGDLLVLYTDGVVEQRSTDILERIEALGRFVSDIREQSCAVVADAIVDDFGAESEDDRAVIVLRPLYDRHADYRLDIPAAPMVSLRTDGN